MIEVITPNNTDQRVGLIVNCGVLEAELIKEIWGFEAYRLVTIVSASLDPEDGGSKFF
jgi:hypothetical protein